MIRIFTYIFISILFWIVVPVQAEDNNLSEMEMALYTLINQARVNPLETAASLGMDTRQVLNDLPDLQDILINGLPALYYNSSLRTSARNHVNDMLARDYYDRISPEGTTPEERMRWNGYVPEVSGETLGVLGFLNFINSSDAVNQIFENMFRDELKPDRTEKRYILGADIEEVGIGFGSGRMTLGGNRFNTYLVVCDFGNSAVSDMELELLQMINQARKNPIGVAAAMGMDTEKIWSELPELHEILEKGIPPLRFDARLYLSATNHAQDMLTNNYYSEFSSDGSSVYDRAATQGYTAVAAAEAMRMLVTTDFTEPVEGAEIHFRRLFERELTPGYTDRIILNPSLKDAGIRLISITPDMWTDRPWASLYSEYYTLLMIADFASDGDDSRTACLQGMVYKDLNDNNLFDFSEGISGMPVLITGENGQELLATDHIGSFTLPLETGIYQVNINSDMLIETRWQEIGFENQLAEFLIK